MFSVSACSTSLHIVYLFVCLSIFAALFDCANNSMRSDLLKAKQAENMCYVGGRKSNVPEKPGLQ